jgi:hypothetical protein
MPVVCSDREVSGVIPKLASPAHSSALQFGSGREAGNMRSALARPGRNRGLFMAGALRGTIFCSFMEAQLLGLRETARFIHNLLLSFLTSAN